MSFTLISRNRQRSKSQTVLKERVIYIENPNDPNHAGKTLLPAKNHNCPGPRGEDFMAECIRADDEYQEAHLGRRGKPSTTLFVEIIYSSPTAAHLNDLERGSIENMALNEFARNTAARFAWHLDPATGRADLHILLAAKDDDYPPRIALWRDFGGKNGKHLYASMDRLGTTIVKDLNKGRTPDRHLKSAEQVHKEKRATFSEKEKPDLISELAALNLSQSELVEGIKSLGYNVTKDTDKNVSVLFPGHKRAARFNKSDLLKNIAEAPAVIKTKEAKEKNIVESPAVEKTKEWKPKKYKADPNDPSDPK
jgi:hypothetical protein